MLTDDVVIDIAREMLWCIIKSSAPMLIVSLVIGLIISIFQTVTSIQEQTLTFVPKLLAIFIVMILCGSWILNNIVEFFENLCAMFPQYVG